jgi:DNA segregation ATPase FtsK/SpoIIIE-like protein
MKLDKPVRASEINNLKTRLAYDVTALRQRIEFEIQGDRLMTFNQKIIAN